MVLFCTSYIDNGIRKVLKCKNAYHLIPIVLVPGPGPQHQNIFTCWLYTRRCARFVAHTSENVIYSSPCRFGKYKLLTVGAYISWNLSIPLNPRLSSILSVFISIYVYTCKTYLYICPGYRVATTFRMCADLPAYYKEYMALILGGLSQKQTLHIEMRRAFDQTDDDVCLENMLLLMVFA